MSESTVELVYFEGCPNAEGARASIRSAFADAGVAAEWAEWDVMDEATPQRYKAFPSPTVLVAGVDVQGEGADVQGEGADPQGGGAGDGAVACRSGGVPTTAQIREALRAAT